MKYDSVNKKCRIQSREHHSFWVFQELVAAQRRSSPRHGNYRSAPEPPPADAASGVLFLRVVVLDRVAGGSTAAASAAAARGPSNLVHYCLFIALKKFIFGS